MRTAIGTFGGSLSTIPPWDLTVKVLHEPACVNARCSPMILCIALAIESLH